MPIPSCWPRWRRRASPGTGGAGPRIGPSGGIVDLLSSIFDSPCRERDHAGSLRGGAVAVAKRVVVVDDDADVRRLLEAALAPPEFDTRAFADPRDALMKLHDIAPDLIV